MYDIWALSGVIMIALLIGGFVWLVLFIFGKAFFEDLLGGLFKKFKKKKEDDDDFYVY